MDHPRRCGENFRAGGKAQCPAGSPPQVRGKLDDETAPIVRYRITPAGAGKTRHARRGDGNRQDHPRRCGENHASISTPDVVPGSPPQVRGKPGYTDEAKKPLGITPAGAGKTSIAAI